MRIQFRHWILTFLCLLCFGRDGLVSADDRPNFMVILCDDLGFGDLGCYGHPQIRTPNLDRLASQGMQLTDCYSAAPICSPSRAGLLTGRTPSRAGIYSWIAEKNPMQLRGDETTIATVLRGAGYDTCHVGKWHLNGWFNDPRHTQPGDHGFDYWFATQNNAAPTHENPGNFVRNGEPVGELQGYSCQLVADEAIRWLKEQQSGDRPFFQFVCFHEPHEPIASPPDLVAGYPQATKEGEALYYANVENMDRAVGRLMATLDKLQLNESTLVFFTSDNGPEALNRYKGAWRSHGSPGPLRGMKLHLHDGGIRVPGILRWTGRIAAGQVSHEPLASLDLFPSCCALAGIDVPDGKTLDGASFVPLLSGAAIVRSKPLFWHYFGGFGNRQVAVRDGDWKLVAGWDGPSDLPTGASLRPGDVGLMGHSQLTQFELYRVAEDVSEADDLSTQGGDNLHRLQEFARETYRNVLQEGPDWSFDR
ncbi:MAG: sulfatase-like hydrolase/transferase [Planctomycetaceae bacterium]|nr:sulfatase-like hydrolase/transferase [Planctomycetaceae bacterium]